MEISLMAFGFITAGAAISGSIIGGLIVGWFQLKAVKKEHENSKERKEAESKAELDSFLEGIHDETETLLRIYNEGVGKHLDVLPPGQPFLWFYVANKDYFPVFKSGSHLLGQIKNYNLRRSIIESYITANGILDTLALNNYYLEKREHFLALFAETQSSAHKERYEAYIQVLTDYAPKIKEYHVNLKHVVETLFQNLRTSGVYHRD